METPVGVLEAGQGEARDGRGELPRGGLGDSMREEEGIGSCMGVGRKRGAGEVSEPRGR